VNVVVEVVGPEKDHPERSPQRLYWETVESLRGLSVVLSINTPRKL
jgi:hypothetical protein